MVSDSEDSNGEVLLAQATNSPSFSLPRSWCATGGVLPIERGLGSGQRGQYRDLKGRYIRELAVKTFRCSTMVSRSPSAGFTMTRPE